MGKTYLEIPRSRWENDIKMYVNGIKLRTGTSADVCEHGN